VKSYILSTNQKHVYVYELEWVPITNRWYQLKIIHTQSTNMSIHKESNWYQLKEFNDTNWSNNNNHGITHITMKKFELVKIESFVN